MNLEFRYTVIRLWEEAFEPLRSGDLGLVPLSLLTDEAAQNLDGAFQRVEERLQETGDATLVTALRSASYFLLGLRYDEDTIQRLYRSVTMLEVSTTYQATIRRGEIREAQRMVLLLGNKRFGPVSAETETALRFIQDRERLERMCERLLDVTTWEDLLGTP